MKIKREELLAELESVQPGLSNKEELEQSSCYVFKDGQVVTFNDELACSIKCNIGLEGAIHASALLDILRKLPEEFLDIEAKKGEIVIIGKKGRRKCGITREAKISLPISVVDKPGEWKEIPDGFLKAIERARWCASSNPEQFKLTCIHISPKWIEACDNAQVSRTTLATGVQRSILVRRDSIKHAVDATMTHFCETKNWIHFKNETGLVLSCRRFVDEYVDNLERILEFKGSKITIPNGIGDAADKASLFLENLKEEPQVKVDLSPGQVVVGGRGMHGWFREKRSLSYSGPALSFYIAPKLLIDLAKQHKEAEITEGKLRIVTGKTVYVVCLSPVKDS